MVTVKARPARAGRRTKIEDYAADDNVEICLNPTYAAWANPIEPQVGPLRTFVIADSDHPNHTVLAGPLQQQLR